MDPRLRARRAQVLRAAGRRRLRRLLVILIVVCVGVGVLGVVLSPVFRVRHVRVDGVSGVLRADVEAGAQGLLGKPLFFADLDEVAAKLRLDPRLVAVKVAREPPGTVRIVAARRVPIAVAPLDHGFAVLAADGVVVGVLQAVPPGLPGLLAPGVPTEPGAVAAVALDALRALTALPPSMAARVVQLRLDDGFLSLLLDGGLPVAFGRPAEDAARKGQVLEALLSEVEAKGWSVSRIDVVSADAPAVVQESRKP